MVCNSRGTIYWLEDSALRKIENGTVWTVPLTRPETPGYLFYFHPANGVLSLAENDNTLYISDFYGHYGYCILKCDLTTGVLTRIIGINPKDGDPYHRDGKETDGPALTHVGFNSGARGTYDPFHNAIWVGGPDHRRFRWMRLNGDGWVRTVFGARRPETETQKFDLAAQNSLGFPAEQFSLGLSAILGLDSEGGVYIMGVSNRGGIWRAYNTQEAK